MVKFQFLIRDGGPLFNFGKFGIGGEITSESSPMSVMQSSRIGVGRRVGGCIVRMRGWGWGGGWPRSSEEVVH